MATSSSPSQPVLSLTLNLSPQTYSFTNPHPPSISLTLLSHSSKPFTLFTFQTPLNPHTGLTQDGFPITDLSTTPPSRVPQDSLRLQRMPYSRARGSGDDRYFITVYPNTPLALSSGFCTGGGKTIRPYPRHVVEKGWIPDKDGNPTSSRMGTKGSGVNGLESGKRYRVDVNLEKLRKTWWIWGTRDDVLVDERSLEWNLSELKRGEGELQLAGKVEGVEFEIL
ncbi:MAG: hypothetical protein Q9216_000798 [Gyalolechia sp. 2 TL-2023]